MRAIMQRCYGVPEGIRLESIAKPAPGEGQVLIKVHASSVNPAEWYGVTGQPQMIRLENGIGAPEGDGRAGFDFAGIVEAVGPNVTRFKPGDEVFGGVGGALAEYVVARETGSHRRASPQNMTFEEAAAIPIAAITALQGLARSRRHRGRAEGAHQWRLRWRGNLRRADREVFRRRSDRRLQHAQRGDGAFARRGSRHRLHERDFTEGKERYDLILDNVGNHGFFAMEDVMKPDGIIVIVGGSKKGALLGPIKRIAWMKARGALHRAADDLLHCET